jgi:8-oxo-dGTP diphosphatase
MQMGANEQGANITEGRWLVIPRTLCFVLNGDDVLLMKRAPHKRIFPNRYNGVGGHIERHEDPRTSAKREIKEETGLTPYDLKLRAIYNVDAGEVTGIVLFIFTAWSDERFVTTSNEGTLHWVKRRELGLFDLVDDLPQLLPRILTMRDDDPPIFYHVSYDENDVIRLRDSESL